MAEHIKVAVIGHGEAADLVIDSLLVASFNVAAFNPAASKGQLAPPVGSIEEAVADADLVLSFNPPAAIVKIAQEIAPLLKPGALYADLNTGTPGMKRQLASLFGEGSFADVTMRLLESGSGAKIAMAAAGTGAKKFIEMLEPAAIAVEYISEKSGEAAAREILRSILDKSMAAAIIDFLWAAESLGVQDWAYQESLAEFNASSAQTVKDYLTGTAQYLKRRQIEMMDIDQTLRETGYESTVVPAVETNYSRILHGKRVPFSKIK